MDHGTSDGGDVRYHPYVSVQFSQIEGALENFYGIKPKIQCAHPKVHNRDKRVTLPVAGDLQLQAHLAFLLQQNADIQVLAQIEICFNPDFTLLDCEKQETVETPSEGRRPPSVDRLSDFSVCDHDVPVYYPPLS